MPSKPVLSDADKEAIRAKLRGLCESCWIAQGYKKTSVKALCERAGISIGTFYALYPTKEDLFFATIEAIQGRLKERFLAVCAGKRTKEGFAEAMKALYREYDGKPFLYNVNTADFRAFLTKLPEDAVERIRFDSFAFFRQATEAAGLTLRMEPPQAQGILSALLATVSAKETLSETCDRFAVFDCMTDTLTARIFE